MLKAKSILQCGTQTLLKRQTLALARPSLLLASSVRPVTVPGLMTQQIRSFGYDKRVIDHYENPRNVGTLNKNDKDVGTGLVGAPACGDVMKL